MSKKLKKPKKRRYKHSYVSKVTRLAKSGQLPKGEVVHIDVIHDDGCPRLRGGRCSCDPEVSARPDTSVLE